MTNTETPPNNDPAYIRQLFDSMQRLVGSLVNELQAAREAMAERDRKTDDLARRFDALAAIDVSHAELLAIWSERLTWMEDLFIAKLAEQDELSDLQGKVGPLRRESRQRVGSALRQIERVRSFS